MLYSSRALIIKMWYIIPILILLSFTTLNAFALSQSSPPVTGVVTHIVDGDTIDVKISNGEQIRIRLALVGTPERGEPGFATGKAFTANECPVGSNVVVDPDSGQAKSYNRNVAVVYCIHNLNEELLKSGLALTITRFCSTSEFSRLNWTGC